MTSMRERRVNEEKKDSGTNLTVLELKCHQTLPKYGHDLVQRFRVSSLSLTSLELQLC